MQAVELQKIVGSAIEALGYEFVGCEWQSGAHKGLLRVFIDSPNGVNLDDCTKASRQIGSVLDVEDAIKGKYVLEVSSPGLDRPLFTLEHFQRFVGSKAMVRLRIPVGERRNFTGIIEAIEGDVIQLRLSEQELCPLMFKNIDKARLVPDLSKGT